MSLNDYRIIPNITRSLIYGEELKIYDTDDHNAYITYKNKEIFQWFKSIDQK